MTSRGQRTTTPASKQPSLVKTSRLLPGRGSVTGVSEVGEGRGESSSPICREERGDLSSGIEVEQAVSKDARRLH